ncbi:hypothetical protein PVAP13_4NG208422 [Panicum virgatum]|uniref:Uncharacterized protein n=1 Tax=Panicum virgatum TaxID=38727 RepID=A0A8T0T9C8_PANVG|nr:hypothetical protein PVAP13_4NG208422 [Panicum virgatum]
MYESDTKMIHFLVLLRWLEGISRYLLKLIPLCDFNLARVLWLFVHPKTPPPAQTARIIPVPPAAPPCPSHRPRRRSRPHPAVVVAVIDVYRPTLASGRQRVSPHSFAGSLPARGAASRPRHRRRRTGPRSLVVDRPTQASCLQRTSPHSATGIACPLGCPSRRSR